MARLDLTDIPVFCGHEHWGSIAAYGTTPEGFRADVECGAAPNRDVTLWDILLDPYFGGWVAANGDDFHGWARANGFDDFHTWAKFDPEAAWNALCPAIESQRLVGGYQVLRQGILRLYEYDLDLLNTSMAQELNEKIAERYRSPINWIKKAAREEKLTPIIRPVHPEFYLRKGPFADEEQQLIRTVMRIDPLLELWRKDSPRREQLGNAVGVVPHDAASWREFILKLFDLAERHSAVGIKQLQAYFRDLDFVPRTDEEIVWLGEDLSADKVRAFQDWVVLECCREAERRRWPFQIHVGTANLPHSNPLPLSRLAQRYPNLPLVLLHCWPYIDEAAFLTKFHQNIYIDACWQITLNPMFLERSLRTWLGFVPVSRLMFSQDATSVEMAVGSASMLRWILARVLENYGEMYGVEKNQLEKTAKLLLYENGRKIYRLSA